MSLRLAILCPGQGGQHPAMFDLIRADARGAAFLQDSQLDDVLGRPLDDVLNDRPSLFANRNAQPLIVTAQLATWHAIADEVMAVCGVPAAVAGYSVGEVSAYGIAGVFDAHDAVRIAAERARYMDAAAEASGAGQQGLMSVGGIMADEARAVLERHGAYVAIVTGDDTLIAGGAQTALSGAAAELDASGARTGMVPVGLASHTPLMQQGVAPFAELLKDAVHSPQWPLLAGVTGQFVHDAGPAKELLVRQLTHTIQWSACMDALAEQGINVALELGPCNALTRMLRTRHPDIACRSLSDFRSLDGMLSWLRRQAD